MKGLRYSFLLGICLCISFLSNAQVLEEISVDEVLLKKQMSGNLFLHNLGWGFGMRYGLFKDVKKDAIFEFDFAKFKHPKEVKIANPAFQRPPSYVYGKMNETFFIRLGYGFEQQIFRKGEKNGVEVRYHLSGGLTNAILKPVYLLILPLSFEAPPIPKKYDPEVHFNEDIYGVADFSYGLNEIGYRPGVYGKFGFLFEWGELDEDIRTFETGITIDAFPSKIPIMAFIENKHTFVSFYLAMSLGKRW